MITHIDIRERVITHARTVPMASKRAGVACGAGFMCLATMRWLWHLKIEKRDDCELEEDVMLAPLAKKSAANNISGVQNSRQKHQPLIIELTDDAVKRKLLAPLRDALCRGGGLVASPYELHLDKNSKVVLIRVGFSEHARASLGEMSSAEERRLLHQFVSRIRLDPKTSSGKLLASINGGGYTHLDSMSLLDGCKQKKIIKREFYRHDRAQAAALNQKWRNHYANGGILEMFGLASNVPADNIRECLGEDVAMYFEFLGFYTRALVTPAICGVMFFLLGSPKDVRWWIVLSIIVGVWTSIFFGLWGQHRYSIGRSWMASEKHISSNEVNAGRWGVNEDPISSDTSDSESDEDADAEKISETTGAISVRKIITRRSVSMSLSVLLLVLVVFVDYRLLDLKRSTDTWLAQPGVVDELGTVTAKLYSTSPGIMKAIAIALFGNIFSTIVEKLVAFESHTDHRDAEDSKLLKLCAFNFVSNFLYLYFYAFIERDIAKLKSSLITVLVMSLAIQNFTEVLLPLMQKRFVLARLMNKYANEQKTSLHKDAENSHSANAESALSLTHMYIDYTRTAYEGTFGDYLELFIQFGQVTIFATVFPLGAVLALINNVVEQRGDFFKMIHELNPLHPASDFSGHGSSSFRDKREMASSLSHDHHQGFAGHHLHGNKHSKNSIDTWMTAFHMISYIAVATNIALLGVDQDPEEPGYQGPFSHIGETLGMDIGTELTFAALFLVEHGLMAAKSWISFILPPRGGLLAQAFKQNSKKCENPDTSHLQSLDNNSSSGSNTATNNALNNTYIELEETVFEFFEKENVSSSARKKYRTLLRHYKDRVTIAERMREEAIAWAAEIVPPSTISSHFEAIQTKEKKG